MKNKIRKNIRGQNEIVGFVIIVVIVTIVGLVFLSLAIGRGETKKTSAELSYFLEASMYYTTDCATGFIPQYKDLKDLIKSCYENELETCLNEKTVCEALESTIEKLILSLKIGKDLSGNDFPNKAANITIFDEDDATAYEPFFTKQIGDFSNCSLITGSSHQIALSSINKIKWINFELDVCKR